MVAMELASVGEETKFDMTVTVKHKRDFWPRLGLVVIYTIGSRVGDCEQAEERETRADKWTSDPHVSPSSLPRNVRSDWTRTLRTAQMVQSHRRDPVVRCRPTLPVCLLYSTIQFTCTHNHPTKK
jgi:hypothetical protein